MKIVAVANGLTHLGDQLHNGHFFCGDVKTYFGKAILDSVPELKSSLSNEFTNAIQNKVYSAMQSVLPGLPANLGSQLNLVIASHMQDAVNGSIGDTLGSIPGNITQSILTDLKGNAITDATSLTSKLHNAVDNLLPDAITDTISGFQTELGSNFSNVLSAATTALSGDARSDITTLASDTISNVGKNLNDMLSSGPLGSQISDAFGAGIGPSIVSSLTNGGKLVIGSSGIMGAIPSLSGIGKSTILGSGSMILGTGSKMIAMAEGALSVGGLKLDGSGVSIGGFKLGASGFSSSSGGPSGFSMGSGGISVGDSNTGVSIANGQISVTGLIKVGVFAANTLPAANSSLEGARAHVSDASSNAFYSIVTGGGSLSVPVFSDGTNWRVG